MDGAQIKRKTPLANIQALIAARRSGDVEAALACYETNAVIVVQPGETVRGEKALRTFVEASIALRLRFFGRRIIEHEDVALHFSGWTGTGIGKQTINGQSADVLRRQPEGAWLIAIDNPWGSTIVGH